MDDQITCAACGDPITEDQTAIRLTAGVGTDAGGFGAFLMRPDVYLHAGRPSAGPWGDEPNGERWCATPEHLTATLWPLRVDATSGGSGTYRGD